MPGNNGLTVEQIADLVTTTQKDLGRLKWTDLTSDLQEYTVLPNILKKNRIGFQSGIGIQFNLMVGTSGAAKNTKLFAKDNVVVSNQMKVASIPWRHSTTNYAFERREISMNRNPARIVELIKTRRIDGMVSLADLLEGNFWSKPPDSTDEETPFGIDYWVVRNATEGFNGGNPAGFSAGCAGFSSVTYPRFRNWTAQYALINSDDFVTKVRKAATYTKFAPPVQTPTYNTGDKLAFYTNYAVSSALEKHLGTQNDNLGADIDKYDGMVRFRRRPVQWVPKLDADTGNPFYGINWGQFKTVFLSGEYMVESKPKESPDSHTTMEVHIDLTYNWMVRDRRRNFVVSL